MNHSFLNSRILRKPYSSKKKKKKKKKPDSARAMQVLLMKILALA
jgi:hypothetical protein